MRLSGFRRGPTACFRTISPSRALRERRTRFYLRCGAGRSLARSRVYGVPYQILTLPCAGTCDGETARRTLRVFYRDMLPGAYAAGDVCIG